MDERARSYQGGDAGMSGKRGSDATLQQNENAEKVEEPKTLDDEPQRDEPGYDEPRPSASNESV
jgi:hypothetical protein